jgi:superfamily I DNA/RNA helicase
VKISTVESAKGHEFQHVFILNVIERVVPRSREPEDIPYDAARLYVAMTRARDTLWICYSSSRHSTPSRYLTTIQDACQEMEYMNGKLKKIK